MSQVMQLGFNPAPAHFQNVMHATLDGPVLDIPRPQHATYIDDVTVHGKGWAAVMRDSIRAVARLGAKGLPLGADKCFFLGDEVTILGYEVQAPAGEYRVGAKALGLLLGAQLPRTVRELQGLLGKFNFCSTFIPDYRRKVRPLLSLLQSRNDGRWTKEHTQIANDLARCVQQRIKLGLPDYTVAGRLHVDCDERDCSAILVQGVGEAYRVVSMIGRELQALEQAASLLERLLLTATWAIKRLARITLYLPALVMVLPHPAAVASVELG